MEQIQVGTIAYKDRQTKKYSNSHELLAEETPMLLHGQKELYFDTLLFIQKAIDEYLEINAKGEYKDVVKRNVGKKQHATKRACRHRGNKSTANEQTCKL